MNPRVSKIVLVIQDLKTKDKQSVAVVSGDVHVLKSDSDKSRVISFQMLLGNHKEFNRCVNDLVTSALQLDAKKKK